MSRTKEKIEVHFVGENAEDVTGSCIWIKTPDTQVILECGLFQCCGKDSILKQYKINNRKFEFKPKNLDAIFVMHNHADHCGNVPKCFKEGANCPLIMPKGSYEILKILLNDSANIMERDANTISEQFERDYQPIYDKEDVENALINYKEYDFDEVYELNPYVKFRFVSSQHILNSAQLELWITCNNITKKILYTSDLGNLHVHEYYTHKFKGVSKADVVIGEATYAGTDRIATAKTRKSDLAKIKTVVQETTANNGKVLFPCFANQRTQVMVTELYKLFGNDPTFNTTVLIDSPMAANICRAIHGSLNKEQQKLWKEVSEWKNLRVVSDHAESKGWREYQGPLIVCASSGMLQFGRSVMWTSTLLKNYNNTIMFCGYAASGSLADIIKNGSKKYVKIDGKRVYNRAKIVSLTSFSSHMQKDDLKKYYGSIECDKIILVHGDKDARIAFAPEVEEERSKNNLTGKVIIANKDYILRL